MVAWMAGLTTYSKVHSLISKEYEYKMEKDTHVEKCLAHSKPYQHNHKDSCSSRRIKKGSLPLQHSSGTDKPCY